MPTTKPRLANKKQFRKRAAIKGKVKPKLGQVKNPTAIIKLAAKSPFIIPASTSPIIIAL
jgi:hypothetical protein